MAFIGWYFLASAFTLRRAITLAVVTWVASSGNRGEAITGGNARRVMLRKVCSSSVLGRWISDESRCTVQHSVRR